MPDRPWKKWEREVAALIGGRRYAANSGADIDCESLDTVAQCKHVRRLGLPELASLAEGIAIRAATDRKLGIVAVKVRAGKGQPSPEIIVMSVDMFRKMLSDYQP